MTGLAEIGVRVEIAASGLPMAMLREIESLVEAFIHRGASGSIDLRSLPLAPGDREALLEALGEGEVTVEVRALGITQVRETGIAGVWWVTHANADGEILAELIEVAPVPEILKAHPEDARAGLERLRILLTEPPKRGGRDDGR